MQNWAHKDGNDRGFINFLSGFLSEKENESKIQFPDFSQSKKLFLFSDYSGDHSESKFLSYSILIIDEQSFRTFLSSHKVFWQEHNLENRIIDYKKLNDRIRSKALLPFLKFCNNLNGLILTIVISKNIKSIFQEEKPKHINKNLVLWRSGKVQEKILRIREFILLSLIGLGKEAQDVQWITDNDDIVANNGQLNALNKFMKEGLLKHLDYELENFSIITLSNDSEEKTLEKLCSLPDLIAGTLVDFIGNHDLENKHLKEGEILTPIKHEKQKVNPITNWLSKNEDSHNLKKVNITITESNVQEGMIISLFRFPEF